MNISSFTDQTTIIGTESPSGTFVSSRSAQLIRQNTYNITAGTGALQIKNCYDAARVVAAASGQAAQAGTAPTVANAATTGGNFLQSTTYFFTYTYYNSNGETGFSSEGSVAVPSGTNTNTITVTAPSLPSGATGTNWYCSTVTGKEVFCGTFASNTGTLTAVPLAAAIPPSNWNTTGITTDTINLSTVLDPFGAALAAKGVCGLHIENPSANYPMSVFGGGTFAGPLLAVTTKIFIPPASHLHLPAYFAGGWPVFAGVNDMLRIATYDPAGITYDIVIPVVQ